MTIYAPTDLDGRQLAQITTRVTTMHHQVAQLTTPFTTAVRQRAKRVRTRWVAVDHPPLLDQLRMAAAGSLSAPQRGAERRRVPDSACPPGWRQDASQRLGDIRAGVGGWRARLGLPRHLLPAEWDRCHQCLTHLTQQRLDPPTAGELATDVDQWWRWAAAQSGWTTAELETVR